MIGIDIVKTQRISRLKNKYGEKFLLKFLTKSEIKLAKNDDSLAGIWASKEAISKALGSGIGREFSFLGAKISKDKKGAPRAKFTKSVNKKIRKKKITLSVTHDGGFAIAVAVVK